MSYGNFSGTTVVGVKSAGSVAVAGDGQVSLGERTAIKHGASKVRKIYKGLVIAGFAGSTADALTLFEKFESKLDEYRGQLLRAAVELTKEWRTDKILRRLEALLITASKEKLLVISGNGDVIEPDDGIAAIGSGGPYAMAAAKALRNETELPARKIAEKSLYIASTICVYTNDVITVEALGEG